MLKRVWTTEQNWGRLSVGKLAKLGKIVSFQRKIISISAYQDTTEHFDN